MFGEFCDFVFAIIDMTTRIEQPNNHGQQAEAGYIQTNRQTALCVLPGVLSSWNVVCMQVEPLTISINLPTNNFGSSLFVFVKIENRESWPIGNNSACALCLRA
jgi:hypothetical protein